MGELPALRITIRKFAVWRGGVLGLAVSAVVVLCAWAVQAHHAQHQATMWLALSLVAVAAGLGASLWRVVPVTLAFDGSGWLAWSEGRADAAPMAVEVRLCMDLGAWMLLRLIPSSREARSRPRWVPVQFSAPQAQWHALRCAIYSSARQVKDDSVRSHVE
ncbi:MAG: hypothetical protein ABL900_02560 [Burkholderiaceae bacterium]